MYYTDFFHLKEAPFSIAPNPRYLFMSERHREALAHLLYGIVNGNGFVALTGEVGTGKTTLCNCLLEQVPEHIDLALVLNPRVSAVELLATVCDELGIDYPTGCESLKILLDLLNAYLLDAHGRGRNTVLLIDEAQNLSIDVLEQIRLLTNLETHETKLLQIILVGQPELNQLLAQSNLRQLNQRITARYHIAPLSLDECLAYIGHRLKVAGSSDSVFSRRAVTRVFRLSGGIPRLINIICDRAMLGAYSLGTHRIDTKIVEQASAEVLLKTPDRSSGLSGWVGRVAIAISLSLIVAGFYLIPFPLSKPLVAQRPPLGETTSKNSGASNHSRIELESPLFEDMFGELVLAAKSGLGASPVDQNPEVPVDPLRSVAASPVETNLGSLEIPVIPAGPASDDPEPVAPPESPETRFIERISDPGLNLYAVLPQLFRQWHIDGEPRSNNLCQAAHRSGLRCLVQHGTWNYLLSLNRPATLEFALQKGVTRYATLIRVDDEATTFNFLNDDPVSFPLSEVLPFWQGQFALLWKPPAPDTALLMRGHSNPAVSWLRQTLNAIQGTSPASPVSLLFDQSLEERVIAFQNSHGLEPDGKVGAETIILLNTLSDLPEIPKLKHEN